MLFIEAVGRTVIYVTDDKGAGMKARPRDFKEPPQPMGCRILFYSPQVGHVTCVTWGKRMHLHPETGVGE